MFRFPISRRAAALSAAGLLPLLSGSCALFNPPPPPAPPVPVNQALSSPVLYDWQGDEVPGPVSVTIDLSEQKANLYRGDVSVGWTYVATGRKGHSTPTGTFKILEKIRHKSSNTYGVILNAKGKVIDSDARRGREAIPDGGRFVGASMPYWMRLTGYGIGMHKGPIPNPGSPASHGCIRLPEVMAAKLFSLAEKGTPVKIQP